MSIFSRLKAEHEHKRGALGSNVASEATYLVVLGAMIAITAILYQQQKQEIYSTFCTFGKHDSDPLIFLALFLSLWLSHRCSTIAERYSSSLMTQVQLTLLAISSIVPVWAMTFWSIYNCYETTVYPISNRILAELGETIHTTMVIDVIWKTGTLALIAGSIAAIIWLAKAVLFPRISMRRSQDGLALSANNWAFLIGERRIAWEELASVSVSTPERAKIAGKRRPIQKLNLKLKNNKTYCVSFEDLHKSVNPSELMNDLRTYASNAIDQSCLIRREASNDHEYTELWLKYFSSSASRTRTGALQAGELLHHGRYEIAGELGQGGQGTAYLACAKEASPENLEGSTACIKLGENDQARAGENLTDVQTIVLKEYILPVHRGEAILQQSMKKLQHEASILSRISHPNIVELKDMFVEDHRGYLVLEYVDGHVLKQMVQAQGPQTEVLVIEIALQLCDALEYLHNMDPPVIHRDLTPDNVILQPNGKVKLVDFNVAQQLEPTATATVVGKHAYIPPEQFRGKPTRQSDIFAMGGTLHFLLTGQEPEPLNVSHPKSLVATVSEGLDAIVARATALDQQIRFTDARELREALLALNGKRIEIKASEQQESPVLRHEH